MTGPLRVLAIEMLRRVDVTWMSSDSFTYWRRPFVSGSSSTVRSAVVGTARIAAPGTSRSAPDDEQVRVARAQNIDQLPRVDGLQRVAVDRWRQPREPRAQPIADVVSEVHVVADGDEADLEAVGFLVVGEHVGAVPAQTGSGRTDAGCARPSRAARTRPPARRPARRASPRTRRRRHVRPRACATGHRCRPAVRRRWRGCRSRCRVRRRGARCRRLSRCRSGWVEFGWLGAHELDPAPAPAGWRGCRPGTR